MKISFQYVFLVSHQKILLIMPVYLDMSPFPNGPYQKQVYFPINKCLNRIRFLSLHQGHCDCGAQQQQWFLFDPQHAYAEYIIDYEYLFSVRQQIN